MEDLLKQILGEVQNLNQRVGNLEQGQIELGDRLKNRIDNLDGQINTLGGRISKLDGRMDRLNNRMDSLDDRMDRLNGRMDKIDGLMDRLEIRIENEVIEKIRGLYDFRQVQNDINEQLVNTLERIEAMEVLQLETANIRRFK